MRPPLKPVVLLGVLLTTACAAPSPEPWIEVGTSMKYDLAFAFYPLSGASIYGTPYRTHYDVFWNRFGPGIPTELQPALDALRALKDQQGFLFGSSLARLFRRLDAQTVAGIADAMEADDPVVLAEVDSWGPGMLDAYQHGGFKVGLVGLLRYLDRAGFEAWWEQEVRPGLVADAAAITDAGVANLPVRAEIARWSLKPAREGLVRLYPVYFMLHQGQQILVQGTPGLVYLADADWPVDFVTLQLVHEVSHNQLLDWSDPQVVASLEVLRQDPYFSQVFEGQKVVSGYIVFQDFVEENVTEGAQMRMAADLGIPVDPKAYLRGHDNGTHVLSSALLQLEAEKGWSPGGSESFQAFYLRMVAAGELAPGRIQALKDAYLNP